MKQPTHVRTVRMRYIPASQAAPMVGYTADHVGRLARQGKVIAYREGKRWWVDIESLKLFTLQVAAEERARQKRVSESQKLELRTKEVLQRWPERHYDIEVYSISDRLRAFWVATATSGFVMFAVLGGVFMLQHSVPAMTTTGQSAVAFESMPALKQKHGTVPHNLSATTTRTEATQDIWP